MGVYDMFDKCFCLSRVGLVSLIICVPFLITHSLTHSLAYSLTQSLAYSLTHSLTGLLTR